MCCTAGPSGARCLDFPISSRHFALITVTFASHTLKRSPLLQSIHGIECQCVKIASYFKMNIFENMKETTGPFKRHSYTVHIQNDSFYWARSCSSRNKKRGMESVCTFALWVYIKKDLDNGAHCEPHHWLFVRKHTHTHKVLYVVLHSSVQVQGQELAECFRLISCQTSWDLQGETQQLIRITELFTYSEDRFDPDTLSSFPFHKSDLKRKKLGHCVKQIKQNTAMIY